jgi:hypothetical protein
MLPTARRTIRSHCGAIDVTITPAATANAAAKTMKLSTNITFAFL